MDNSETQFALLFINKQQVKILAKQGAEEDFRKLGDLQKKPIRAALPRQESTVLKLIKASLVRLAEYIQQYFTSEEQFMKANQNNEYRDIPLGVLITLPSTHPIIRRKNNHHMNTVENTMHGCRRIADLHLACGAPRPPAPAGVAPSRSDAARESGA